MNKVLQSTSTTTQRTLSTYTDRHSFSKLRRSVELETDEITYILQDRRKLTLGSNAPSGLGCPPMLAQRSDPLELAREPTPGREEPRLSPARPVLECFPDGRLIVVLLCSIQVMPAVVECCKNGFRAVFLPKSRGWRDTGQLSLSLVTIPVPNANRGMETPTSRVSVCRHVRHLEKTTPLAICAHEISRGLWTGYSCM